ncbi:MAG: GntR family transcriptional regulator [Burkholderiales bacterium]|nr:GntR family transcriptional regulator [Burkholderiales bacterium]
MNDRLKIRLNSMKLDAPLYREVRRRILQCVAEGEWKPGERLPAESELADRFGVAISTLRAGVRELTAAGVLIRRQGKGTFVAQHDPHSQHFRFSNIYGWERGKISTRREILSMRKVRADRGTMELLRLGEASSPLVHHVVCTLHGVDAVVGIMEIMLPVSLFPKLKPKDLESTTENIYSVYQRACGVTVLRMEERVSARTADADTASILRLRRGHPLLQVERVAYTFNNTPVEVRRRTYEGQQHYYLFTHEELQ